VKRTLVWLALALLACAAQPSRAQDPPTALETRPDTQERDILVMLRMPAPHYRPNANYAGRYDDRAAEAARHRVAAQIARENGLELIEGWPMPLIGVDCFVMRVGDGKPVARAIEQVSRNRMVAWAQPLHSYDTLASGPAGDPLFAAQPAASQWHLADLHKIATGKGVTVAIIDSKIEVGHPDLSGQFIADRDFVTQASRPPELHGTAVAGVIGAKPRNGIGIVGVAPGAKLLALRACTEDKRRPGVTASSCNSLTLAKAIQFALERRADVINMSLSGPQDRLLAMLIDLALQRSITVVAAFDPRREGGGFPASSQGVVAVAEETLPSVPNRVYRAPGRDIPTTEPGGKWSLVNGSSFAAAHVSGLVALLRGLHGAQASPSRIVRDRGGVVDACATLVDVTRDCDCLCAISRNVAARRR